VSHGNTYESSSTFQSYDYDNSLNLENLRKNMKINLKEVDKDENSIVFEIIGIDAPLANALRRILIAEIPTMAIEKVYIEDNTSIIQDEVLAHRLGLIPIKANPKNYEMVTIRENDEKSEISSNTVIEFKLDVLCTRKNGQLENSIITSKDLKWTPTPEEAEKYPSDHIKPVDDDILIMKLRGGQRIKLSAMCYKILVENIQNGVQLPLPLIDLNQILQLKRKFEETMQFS